MPWLEFLLPYEGTFGTFGTFGNLMLAICLTE